MNPVRIGGFLDLIKALVKKSCLKSNTIFAQSQEEIMNYDKTELLKIAMEILDKGRYDLKKNGSWRSGSG